VNQVAKCVHSSTQQSESASETATGTTTGTATTVAIAQVGARAAVRWTAGAKPLTLPNQIVLSSLLPFHCNMEFFSNFEIFEKLGSGAFSIVYKVRRKSDGEFYALKCIKLTGMKRSLRKKALNEVRLLASIDHPNIVTYKEVHLNGRSLYLVTELADCGDLTTRLRAARQSKRWIPESEIWSIFH
jgi:hypothetical protein